MRAFPWSMRFAVADPDTLNPYQPPEEAPDLPEQATPVVGGIKDPRPHAWLAAAAIAVQVVSNLLVSVVPIRPDLLQGIIILMSVLFLLAGVSFFAWYVRCAVNALRVHPSCGIRPLWGVGCYFIPVVNFVCPVIEMVRLVRVTFRGERRGWLEAVAIIWWVAFVLRIVVAKMGVNEHTPAVWIATTLLASGCIIFLILTISHRQARFGPEPLAMTGRPNLQALEPGRAPSTPLAGRVCATEPTAAQRTVLPPKRAPDGGGKPGDKRLSVDR